MLLTADDIRQLNEKIQYQSAFIDRLRDETARVIIGQHHMLDRLLIGLLSNGHVLLEGVPGLAKTLTIKSLAQAIHARFSRIQFTPDLLPADVIGTMIYNQQKNEFVVRRGPIFANFILADEINRAPARDRERRGAALRRVFAFGLHRNFLLAPDIQFTLRVRALVNFSAFGGGRDGIKNTTIRDAGFHVLSDQLVPVTSNADAGIFGGVARSGRLGTAAGFRRRCLAHNLRLLFCRPPGHGQAIFPMVENKICMLSIRPGGKRLKEKESKEISNFMGLS